MSFYTKNAINHIFDGVSDINEIHLFDTYVFFVIYNDGGKTQRGKYIYVSITNQNEAIVVDQNLMLIVFSNRAYQRLQKYREIFEFSMLKTCVTSGILKTYFEIYSGKHFVSDIFSL